MCGLIVVDVSSGLYPGRTPTTIVADSPGACVGSQGVHLGDISHQILFCIDERAGIEAAVAFGCRGHRFGCRLV